MLRADDGALPPGVANAFTTRRIGSLAAGTDGDTLAAWGRAVAALDVGLGPEQLVLMHQVHGAEVAVARAPTGPGGAIGAVDGVVTATRGLVLAVRVADCVPVLLASAEGVGAAHAGWRGTAAGVVPATVAALRELTGEAPEAVRAVIGPHIQVEAYEVGDEVIAGLVEGGVPERVAARRVGARWHADLGAAVAWQLRAAGVGAVARVQVCTTSPSLYSWRADGPSTGRQAGLVVRR